MVPHVQRGVMTGTITVSTVKEVLEQLRQDIVAGLRADGIKPPPDADIPGNCFEALSSWVRVKHRSVTQAPRAVLRSRELQSRELLPWIRSALDMVQAEFERGEDLTSRLTRRFYKSAFNDFLFNHFGIQHMHLGAPGTDIDKTKQHAMSGGGRDLLFVLVRPTDALFLDVLDHRVFESAERTKSLVQVVLRNWPHALNAFEAPGVVSSDLSFETAFELAKGGFTTMFEVNGRFFVAGTVRDGSLTAGKREACTSSEVVQVASQILNRIVELVKHTEANAAAFAELAESRTGIKPRSLVLEVVEAGRVVVLRERHTGMTLFHDGVRLGARDE